jgi:hypothetical protein
VARFLVTYHGSGMPTDPAQMSQAREAFGRWLGEAGSAVVDPGAPLRFGGQVSGGDPTPQVEIGGSSVIQADSLEAARQVLASHPFVSRGGTLHLDEVVAV